MINYLYEPCVVLVIKALERAIADWHKTCSLDPAHSDHVLTALGERRDEYGNYTGGIADICEFCRPHGGPFRELSTFFGSDWCEFLHSYTSVHRDTAVEHLKIITRKEIN